MYLELPCPVNKHRDNKHMGDPRSKAGAWRHCTGQSKAALVSIYFLVIWLWANFTWPKTMLWFWRVPSLQRKWMLLIATALNLPELGWDFHQTAAQGGWGLLSLLTKPLAVMFVTSVSFCPLPLGSLWKELRKAGMPLEVPAHCLQSGACQSLGRLLAHTSCNKEGPFPPDACRQSQSAVSLEQNLQFSTVSAPSCSNNS